MSRRIRANRRRWAQPIPILRVPSLTIEEMEIVRERFEAALRHRHPILIHHDIEVYR